ALHPEWGWAARNASSGGMAPSRPSVASASARSSSAVVGFVVTRGSASPRTSRSFDANGGSPNGRGDEACEKPAPSHAAVAKPSTTSSAAASDVLHGGTRRFEDTARLSAGFIVTPCPHTAEAGAHRVPFREAAQATIELPRRFEQSGSNHFWQS